MSEGEIVFHILEILGLGVILLWVFLKSYYSEKGKNLATKEDIGEITHQVEDVRTQYLQKLEEISHQNKIIIEQSSRKHQLRMAAIDKRLEAHQEAYALWRNLIPNIFNDEKIAALEQECKEWWNNNCLYLEPDAREAFITSYISASMHKEIRDSKDTVETKRNWTAIISAGEVLVKSVELPTITSFETEVPLPVKPENA